MTRSRHRAAAKVGHELLGQKIAAGLQNHQAGRIEAAEALYREVLETDPRNAEALHGLGLVHYQRGDLQDAAERIRQSIGINSTHALYHYHLGVVLQAQGEGGSAAASFRRCLDLDPGSADAHAALGGVRYELGERDLAEEDFRRAIELDPNHFTAHSNLGVALTARCLLEAAIASFREATALCPDHALTRWNNAIALLLSGDFEKGWREYEWRLKRPGSTPTELPRPRWTGDDLQGRTILLHAEQGLGDAIQFCRYVPSVVARGGRVLLAVQPSLKRLMTGLEAV
ncbi:MAG: tetratricopeptide repeat protein, partial [Planctomycetota bacterium]